MRDNMKVEWGKRFDYREFPEEILADPEIQWLVEMQNQMVHIPQPMAEFYKQYRSHGGEIDLEESQDELEWVAGSFLTVHESSGVSDEKWCEYLKLSFYFGDRLRDEGEWGTFNAYRDVIDFYDHMTTYLQFVISWVLMGVQSGEYLIENYSSILGVYNSNIAWMLDVYLPSRNELPEDYTEEDVAAVWYEGLMSRPLWHLIESSRQLSDVVCSPEFMLSDLVDDIDGPGWDDSFGDEIDCRGVRIA